MIQLYGRLLGQFDSLIPFLALTWPEVYEIIHGRNQDGQNPEGIPLWQLERMPDTYTVYQTQVTHSAFLLGYSYYEAFLSDLMRQIYTEKPKMLSPDKKLDFSEILERPDYDQIFSFMVDKELLSIFYQPFEKVIECFDKKFHLKWPPEAIEAAIKASLLRNCIIHNNAVADRRLAQMPGWKIADEIRLTDLDVHQFGLTARRVCLQLSEQAQHGFSLI